MAHRRAKLTLLGRRLLVDRTLVDGIAVAHAADMTSGGDRASCSTSVSRSWAGSLTGPPGGP